MDRVQASRLQYPRQKKGILLETWNGQREDAGLRGGRRMLVRVREAPRSVKEAARSQARCKFSLAPPSPRRLHTRPLGLRNDGAPDTRQKPPLSTCAFATLNTEGRFSITFKLRGKKRSEKCACHLRHYGRTLASKPLSKYAN
ncbi:hypothetical protein SKAU_G00337720 [Synaphobranchus kaupii]|uniref:Uncharacterized protein n=1 Tax=Synaphobranchus kaupii TaxID=118154 RepID=A0A9Q1EMH4_SYNKA|nr:hypothetical protein SKAU_G00337720 [Synaphobranchus kaupii]